MTPRNVFITGATGYIGRVLIGALANSEDGARFFSNPGSARRQSAKTGFGVEPTETLDRGVVDCPVCGGLTKSALWITRDLSMRHPQPGQSTVPWSSVPNGFAARGEHRLP